MIPWDKLPGLLRRQGILGVELLLCAMALVIRNKG